MEGGGWREMSVVKSRASTGFLELTWHVRNQMIKNHRKKDPFSKARIESLWVWDFESAKFMRSRAHGRLSQLEPMCLRMPVADERMDFGLLSQFA